MKKRNFNLKKRYRIKSGGIKKILDTIPEFRIENSLKENEETTRIIIKSSQTDKADMTDREEYLFNSLKRIFKNHEPLVMFYNKSNSSGKVINLNFTCHGRSSTILFFLTDKKVPFKQLAHTAYSLNIRVGKLSHIVSKNIFEYNVAKLLSTISVGLKQEERVLTICKKHISLKNLPLEIICNHDLDALNIDIFLRHTDTYGLCLQVKTNQKNITEYKGDYNLMRKNPYFAVHTANPIRYVIAHKKMKDKNLKKKIVKLINDFLKRINST